MPEIKEKTMITGEGINIVTHFFFPTACQGERIANLSTALFSSQTNIAKQLLRSLIMPKMKVKQIKLTLKAVADGLTGVGARLISINNISSMTG